MSRTRNIATLDLVGGTPGLDLANTINSRVTHDHDYLGDYGDLLDWSVRATTISETAGRELARRAETNKGQAARVFADSVRLREAIYRAFSTLGRGEAAPQADLSVIFQVYGAAVLAATFVMTDSRLRPRWDDDTDLASPLHVVAHAAGQLLMSPLVTRVKECPSCSWLFLDSSRNRTRRWCDMATCGSRDKMRRYHRARRASAVTIEA